MRETKLGDRRNRERERPYRGGAALALPVQVHAEPAEAGQLEADVHRLAGSVTSPHTYGQHGIHRSRDVSAVEDVRELSGVGTGVVIIDKGVVIPPDTRIGIDHDEDRARGFHVSEGGIVVLGKGQKVPE